MINKDKSVAIIGGGPAGLIAAEIIAKAGYSVTVYEHKASLGRKLLMAGRGGLNLTHSEPLEIFLKRYGKAKAFLSPLIQSFSPDNLRQWCEDLGQPTFVGSSGRVFPKAFKASPLLRAWQQRLNQLGVEFKLSHRWTGWDANGKLSFLDNEGNAKNVHPSATLLALGGASWPRLGSDGGWVDILKKQGVSVASLRPSNCGFAVEWSEIFRSKYAGQPLKSATFSCIDSTSYGEAVISHGEAVISHGEAVISHGEAVISHGEAVITEKGIEGGAIYALSSHLRDTIEAKGSATLTIDLRNGLSLEELTHRLSAPRQAKSFSTFLRTVGGLSPLAISLLRETKTDTPLQNMPAAALARHIKAFPLKLTSAFPIDRAISSAGGIELEAIDENMMLKSKDGVFVAGEMLDWEAPTGGYLLQATFSTAVRASQSIVRYLESST